jgi:hypothetical protein
VTLAELQVVAGLELELGAIADFPQGDVVLVGLAGGGLLVRDVRKRSSSRL